MRSAEEVKLGLLAQLQATVPARCAAIATETGRPCPAPALWSPTPARPPGPSQWPAVFVDEIDHAIVGTAERTPDGDPLFEVAYSLAVEFWCRATARDAQAEALGLRARLERAVVEALLDRPSFGQPAMKVDPASLVGDYSPLFEVTQGQQAAAEELRLTIVSIEALTRPVLAEPPLTVTVEVEKLPPL